MDAAVLLTSDYQEQEETDEGTKAKEEVCSKGQKGLSATQFMFYSNVSRASFYCSLHTTSPINHLATTHFFHHYCNDSLAFGQIVMLTFLALVVHWRFAGLVGVC